MGEVTFKLSIDDGFRPHSLNLPQPDSPNPIEQKIEKLIDEFELYDDQPFAPRDIAIVCLIADTGLYPVDLRLLRWKHIFPDYPKRLIADPREVSIPLSFDAPHHRKHSIPNSTTFVTIGEITQARLHDLLEPRTSLSSFVFKASRLRSASKPPGSMTAKTITNRWNEVTRELGYTGLTMHKIRAIRLIEAFEFDDLSDT